MKTAAVILNHNLPDWTDRLYKTLKPYERDDYEVLVFDNGSKPEGVSQYTSFSSETNLYFGGGLNAAMQMVLDDEQYDSLLFVSNDLTIHPYNFVRTLRKNMFVQPSDGQTPEEQSELAKLGFLPDIDRQVGNIRFDLVAACFYNVEPDGQCHWKTMHNWGTAGAREVPFVDFQCPLISRRLIKAVGEIDADLIYGWGPDTYFAITCNKQGYRMAVLDNVCILHHNSVTIKTGVAGLNMADYCRKAEIGQYNFFTKKGLMKEFHEVRNAGASYKLLLIFMRTSLFITRMQLELTAMLDEMSKPELKEEQLTLGLSDSKTHFAHLGINTGCVIETLVPPLTALTFSDGANVIGTLSWANKTLEFTGNVEESAKVFAKYLASHFVTRNKLGDYAA